MSDCVKNKLNCSIFTSFVFKSLNFSQLLEALIVASLSLQLISWSADQMCYLMVAPPSGQILPPGQKCYLWFRTNKINKVDPFLLLVNLVRENNSTDVMNANDILPDVEGCDSKQEEDAIDCESDSKSLNSTSKISDYPCPCCHTDFISQEEVIEHMEIC